MPQFLKLNRRTLTLLFLGFASAIPIVMCGATLTVRLSELGLTKTTIGLLGILHLPYSFRILWGPIIDHKASPWFSFLGWRKGWSIFALIAASIFTALLGWVDPGTSPWAFAASLAFTAFASGIVYMTGIAYELESLRPEEYPMGSACFNAGYRIGLLVAGAGTLYLATYYSWETAYTIVASGILIGALAVFWQPEPEFTGCNPTERLQFTSWSSIFYRGIADPVFSFWKRPGSLTVLAFILAYKLGDDLAHGFLPAFYLEAGFTKTDIAVAVKLFGMGATVLGVFLGGVAAQSLGITKSLFIFGAMHALSYVTYIGLYYLGPHLDLLCTAVAVEHITGGMVITTFIAFLWRNTETGLAAMQYALFWSILSVKHVAVHAIGGWLADKVEWPVFFAIATVLFIPGLILLVSKELFQPFLEKKIVNQD